MIIWRPDARGGGSETSPRTTRKAVSASGLRARYHPWSRAKKIYGRTRELKRDLANASGQSEAQSRSFQQHPGVGGWEKSLTRLGLACGSAVCA